MIRRGQKAGRERCGTHFGAAVVANRNIRVQYKIWRTTIIRTAGLERLGRAAGKKEVLDGSSP